MHCSKYVVPLLLALPTLGLTQTKLQWKWEVNKPIYVKTVIESPDPDESPEDIAKRKVTILKDEATTGRDRKLTLQFVQTVVMSYTFIGKDNVGNNKIVQRVLSAEINDGQDASKPDRNLFNLELTLYVNPRGQVVKLDGYEKLLEAWLGGDRTSSKSKTLTQTLSKQSMMASATDLFGFLPEEAVKPDDNWARPRLRDLGRLGKIYLTKEYVFEGKSTEEKTKDLQRIIVKSKLVDHVPYSVEREISSYAGNVVSQLARAQSTMGAKALQVALYLQVSDATFQTDRSLLKLTVSDLTASNRGTILFDAENGRLREAEQHVTLTGKITFVNDGRDRNFQLSQSQKVTITVHETNPLLPTKPDK